MSAPAAPDEELSAAERRLVEHLEIVRASPPRGDRSLVRRVVRRARWQRALRQPVQIIGAIAAAVVEGVAGLLGVGRGRRP
jgi:hypothetical protein